MSTFERKPLTGSMWVPDMKTHPNAPDFGGRIKVPNGGTEELRSGQTSSYVPGADNRVKEGDDYNW